MQNKNPLRAIVKAHQILQPLDIMEADCEVRPNLRRLDLRSLISVLRIESMTLKSQFSFLAIVDRSIPPSLGPSPYMLITCCLNWELSIDSWSKPDQKVMDLDLFDMIEH